jgi:hypothetical protein
MSGGDEISRDNKSAAAMKSRAKTKSPAVEKPQ